MNSAQLDLAFGVDLPSALRPKRTRQARARPDLAAAPPRSDEADLQVWAQALDAHPDYRVLRRLQPRLHWPESGVGPRRRVCVLDTETTGLDASRDCLMELALLCVDVDLPSGQPVGEVQVYDALEDPGVPIPREIQELTGIKPSMVKGQRLDEARIADLLVGVDWVLAHNASFDRPFVERRLPAFQTMNWACSVHDVPWKTLGHSSAKLESLAMDHGWFYDAHRAEMDCHAVLAVLTAQRSPRGAALAALLEQAQLPSFRLMATHAPFDAKDLLKLRGYRWSAEERVWSTRVRDPQALQGECAWLKEHVYHQRAAVVQLERLDARVRYSGRPGEIQSHPLGTPL